MKLLKCYILNWYLQEWDRFFIQDYMLPTGSPLSPTIANIYTEWFEEYAIKKGRNCRKLWLRYVPVTSIDFEQRSKSPLYLNFYSNHSYSAKKSITKKVVDLTTTICSTPDTLKSENTKKRISHIDRKLKIAKALE